MNTSSRHPDTESLDRLRAGLLDDEPARKTRLEAHLASCETCRKRAQREQLRLWGPESQQALDNRLDKARERALRASRRSSLARFAAPLATAAAVALLAVILVNPVQHQETPSEPRLANNAGAGDVPELYEELDFYLWLADHKANTGDSAT